MKDVFDGVNYLKELAGKNKEVAQNWKICECSGVQGIQGLMEDFRKTDRFIMVDNTPVGSVFRNRAGGFFNRRTYTVHIIYRNDNARKGQSDYDSKMSEVRNIYLQLLSRLLIDAVDYANINMYFQTDSIYYKEPGIYGYGGSAGLYFMISIDQPQDLVYNAEQWSS